MPDGRWLTLETPLGGDVLWPTAVNGTEAISKPFRFEISAQGEGAEVTADQLLNKSVTLSIEPAGDEPRLVNGIVIAFASAAEAENGYRSYQLTVAPKIWTLDLQSGYRIFQDKTVPQIASAVLKDAGVSDISINLSGTYQQREYCVQYGETQLAFLQRLFAEEGIFYYFKHEKNKHTLCICDDVAGYATVGENTVRYLPGGEDENCVDVFNVETNLIPSKWKVSEFNLENPDTIASGTSNSAITEVSKNSFEQHIHGVAQLRDKSDGGLTSDVMVRLAKLRDEAAEAWYEVGHGSGNCASFTVGHKFEFTENIFAKTFVLTEIVHEARGTSRVAGDGAAPSYRNRFTCVPATRPVRMAPPGFKPMVRGPHTATVMVPEGSEIDTDRHGRIKVHFHWNPDDKQSSCFVRVAQSWAGGGWGAMFLPRGGMEVVVQFLEGDPDRPLVTGAVYNAKNAPPWAMPDKKEQSGIMTRSTPKGAAENANWLLFTDTKGSEKVDVQAEKDFLRTVKNDDTLDVRHDQTRTIKNNRTTTISEGNETLTITKGNRSEKLETGNDTLTISQGARTVTLAKGDHSLELSAGNQSVVLNGGNQTTTLKTGNATTSLTAGDFKISCSAGKVAIEAMSGITLTCGASKIELTADGITISGVQVTAKANAKAEIAGPIVNVSGDGMTNIKGGIVKIN